MTSETISLDSRCRTCDRKIGIFQDWYPHPGGGIRHATCEVECFACHGSVVDEYELGFPNGDGFRAVSHLSCFDVAVKENW